MPLKSNELLNVRIGSVAKKGKYQCICITVEIDDGILRHDKQEAVYDLFIV